MLKKMLCERCGREFFYDKKNFVRKYCGKCQNPPKAKRHERNR